MSAFLKELVRVVTALLVIGTLVYIAAWFAEFVFYLPWPNSGAGL